MRRVLEAVRRGSEALWAVAPQGLHGPWELDLHREVAEVRRLITPRTASQLLAMEGLDYRDHLPPGTLCGRGRDGARMVCYYWTPVGTDKQAKLLGRHEVDIVGAWPAREDERT